jgi:hypothetical protein
MEIPKEQILDLLRQQGKDDQAGQADRELPDKVDTDKHAGLLEKFGISPRRPAGQDRRGRDSGAVGLGSCDGGRRRMRRRRFGGVVAARRPALRSVAASVRRRRQAARSAPAVSRGWRPGP